MCWLGKTLCALLWLAIAVTLLPFVLLERVLRRNPQTHPNIYYRP